MYSLKNNLTNYLTFKAGKWYSCFELCALNHRDFEPPKKKRDYSSRASLPEKWEKFLKEGDFTLYNTSYKKYFHVSPNEFVSKNDLINKMISICPEKEYQEANFVRLFKSLKPELFEAKKTFNRYKGWKIKKKSEFSLDNLQEYT